MANIRVRVRTPSTVTVSVTPPTPTDGNQIQDNVPITVGPTPPENPSVNDLWVDTN